jgi:cytochrome c2
LSEVGCTICHRGDGESLHFQRTDHRPSDEAEALAWQEEYHWHKQHHWDYPMLGSAYDEASCVQCHKDSMELIAETAPDLAKGYRLFERYGCYACHKVDWFPTKRRPGPSLKGVAQKTTPEFIASWIADPRGFRPTTWMPQFFHLENWPADETVVISEWGEGREIKGKEWNDTAIAAISAFLLDRSRKEPLPKIPAEGDPVRGRELFRLSGCLACHNMSPFPGREPEDAGDLALASRGTNEHGPNLRGIATKVTPEWLFRWIQEPSSIWSETRMPDLNLPDQDVADIVAYVFADPDGFFQAVPEGWEARGATFFEDVLQEQARWFVGNRTRAQFDASFADEWKDPQDLLVVVGERLVLASGCHSCHEIEGLEDQMPIGTELTQWGSKTVDKLDFGFIPELFASQKGWSHHQVEEFKKYREGWLEQKLAEPRSYDRALDGKSVRVKNPIERLKMPWFDFEPEETRALTGFVVGLVKDEVQNARMVPTPGQASMDHGLRAIRQKNCAACHLIEPGTVTYADEDGEQRTIRAQAMTLSDDEYVAPSLGESFHPFLADYEAYTEEDLEEVTFQLLEAEPGVGDVGDTVTVEGVENVDALRTTAAWGGDFVPLVVDYYRNVWDADDASKTADEDGKVEDVDGEARDYASEAYEKVRWTFAPPFLVDEGYKLQREWFHQFLQDPYPLRRQMRVKMPKFTWSDGDAGAIADYFAQAAARDWPVRYARRALVQQGMSPAEAADAAAAAGISGLSAQAIREIAAGSAPAIEAAFPKFVAWASSETVGFDTAGPVDPTYESIMPRTPSVLEATLEAHPDFFAGMELLTGTEGPNCYQCHWFNGTPPTNLAPVAWAPDLANVRERLRPDWVREWLMNPAKIYPGTAMPANFDGTQWQEVWPGTAAEQVESVLTWLFNLDRDTTP